MNEPLFSLRPLRVSDAPQLLALRLENQAFLQPYEPIRSASFFTLQEQVRQLEEAEQHVEAGTGYAFGIFAESGQKLIGRVNLANVVRGAWQNCTLGYFLDRRWNGKGIMTRAVGEVVRFAFSEAGLHRIQAAVMPHNAASIKVLQHNRFRQEGLSLRYLQINGKWEDHLIFALTADE
ncbi:GNAT family N-acetyltransferase [Brevibacillus composti]|uniref:GNAT family N-acetyltransferase n=1 Tax=Brevibacillus composti TaxID=2796470 RepID=A0A7T5JQ43_9BACL|nr:GNAT family N-acetyltransferase [Brevibacillus composti]QQE75827.1 GNAT family N-acetyltransferase [Brevibacillus composti]QUO42853.1 GNAT family N-acetyltransferase [Brevibacillus composti]